MRKILAALLLCAPITVSAQMPAIAQTFWAPPNAITLQYVEFVADFYPQGQVDIFQWSGSELVGPSLFTYYLGNTEQTTTHPTVAFNPNVAVTGNTQYVFALTNINGWNQMNYETSGNAQYHWNGWQWEKLHNADWEREQVDFALADGSTYHTFAPQEPREPVAIAPEPSTFLLTGTALLALVGWRRRHASGRSAVVVADRPPTV